MKLLLRIIASLEILGGVVGIGLLMLQVMREPLNRYLFSINIVILSIYALSSISGISLWREQPYSYILSILTQLIQLPKIILPSIIFFFSFGIDIYIYYATSYQLSNLGLDFKLGAAHQLSFGEANGTVALGLSIPALSFLLILLLAQLKRRSLMK
jgi:hypothetical protein